MRRWRLQGLALVLGVASVLGLVLPRFAPDDCNCGLSETQTNRLKSQAAHRLQFPALALSVESATAASADPDAGRGKVVVLGLFAVETGEVTQEDAGERVSRSAGLETLLWLAEALLLISAATVLALSLRSVA